MIRISGTEELRVCGETVLDLGIFKLDELLVACNVTGKQVPGRIGEGDGSVVATGRFVKLAGHESFRASR